MVLLLLLVVLLLVLLVLLLVLVLILMLVLSVAVSAVPPVMIGLVQDAIVVLGVLEITFSRDVLAGRSSVSRESEIFFQHLLRRAADFYLRAVAFEGMPPIVVVHRVTFAVAARTRAPRIRTVLHDLMLMLLLFTHRRSYARSRRTHDPLRRCSG